MTVGQTEVPILKQICAVLGATDAQINNAQTEVPLLTLWLQLLLLKV